MVINGKKIVINRANVFVSEMDEAYCDLCRQIIKFGIRTINRTGVDTLSIPGWSYCFDTSKSYPIAETKKIIAANYSKEIQWIHQVQSNDVNWLIERDNYIWNKWMIDSDGIWREYEQGENAIDDPDREVLLMRQIMDHTIGDVKRIRKLDESKKEIMVRPTEAAIEAFMKEYGKMPTIKRATYFGKEYAGTIGQQYGFINATYKDPQCVEYRLKNNPYDRRMQINLWQRKHFAKAVLPSCVFCAEFKVTPDGKLHMFVHQRSADVPAGLPFNISQYALLLAMFAKANNLTPGNLWWSIMDAHIYVDQIDKIEKQLRRYDYMKEYEKYILTHKDSTVAGKYNRVKKLFEVYSDKAFAYISHYSKKYANLTKEEFEKIPMSKRYEELAKIETENDIEDKGFDKIYEESFERKICFEHMLTRENPVLELEEHNSFFDYSTEYVKKGDSYLNENPIGNKEMTLKNYHPTPFISMPVAQ